MSLNSETQCPSRKRRGVLVKLRGPPVAKLHRRAQRRPGGRPGGAPVPYRSICDRAVTTDADVAQKLQSSHRSSRARAQLLLCAQERGSMAPCCHRNGFACPWLSEERQQ